MTTKELIIKLSKFNPETEVVLEDDNGDLSEFDTIRQKEVIKSDIDWIEDNLSEEELDENINVVILSI